MKAFLVFWFLLVLVVMAVVTTWAGLQENVLAAFVRLGRDPWGLATLMDAYFAFLAIWFWIAWKEGRWLPSLLWLLAILGLGNFAIAAYLLLELRRSQTFAEVFSRRKS
jgi:hypothetical protein